jgi:hypothetical protein
MHPVLARAAYAFAEEVAATGLAEAQISPDPKLSRWCGQQVVEHLILSLRKSREELQRCLRSKSSRSRRSTLLEHALSLQVFLGSMPRGLPALPSLTPGPFTPQDGKMLSARLLAEAEELSKVLAECRLVFGLRPCGTHPIYGSLRVEEWRNYHAVHFRHHLKQFKGSVAFARRNLESNDLDGADGSEPRTGRGNESSYGGEPVRMEFPGGTMLSAVDAHVEIKDRTNGDKRR